MKGDQLQGRALPKVFGFFAFASEEAFLQSDRSEKVCSNPTHLKVSGGGVREIRLPSLDEVEWALFYVLGCKP